MSMLIIIRILKYLIFTYFVAIYEYVCIIQKCCFDPIVKAVQDDIFPKIVPV